MLQLLSIFNKGTRFSLYDIDSFSIGKWVFPLKEKKGITITKTFQKILGKSNCKLNKI